MPTYLDGYFMLSFLTPTHFSHHHFQLILLPISLTKLKKIRRKRQCSPATTSVPVSLPSIRHCGWTMCASSQGELLHFTSRSQPFSLTQGFCSANSPLSPLSSNMFPSGFSTWWYKCAVISPILKKNKRKKETPLIPPLPLPFLYFSLQQNSLKILNIFTGPNFSPSRIILNSLIHQNYFRLVPQC